jgi:hypothetical protein
MSKRKLNVGDRVKVVGYVGTGWHGLIGTVEEYMYGTTYDVKFDRNDFYQMGAFDAHDLELVAPSPSSKKPRRTVERTIKLVGVVSITQADIKRDHGPHESGIVEVDGKRIDAEAEFYRLLANTPKDEPKRKRRKKTA